MSDEVSSRAPMDEATRRGGDLLVSSFETMMGAANDQALGLFGAAIFPIGLIIGALLAGGHQVTAIALIYLAPLGVGLALLAWAGALFLDAVLPSMPIVPKERPIVLRTFEDMHWHMQNDEGEIPGEMKKIGGELEGEFLLRRAKMAGNGARRKYRRVHQGRVPLKAGYIALLLSSVSWVIVAAFL